MHIFFQATGMIYLLNNDTLEFGLAFLFSGHGIVCKVLSNCSDPKIAFDRHDGESRGPLP